MLEDYKKNKPEKKLWHAWGRVMIFNKRGKLIKKYWNQYLK